MADETKNDPEQTPFVVTDVLGGKKLEDGIGVCLSGGGFRAMLFHLGSLIRLNELGLLPAIDRFSSVSGGSLAAGILASGWSDLAFDADGVATGFHDSVGGDEFALLLTSVKDRDDVLDVVSRIFGAIRRPAHCLGHQLSIDASIGIALAPQDGTERDQLIKNADLAMYAAKAGGRRTSRFFEPAMDESARARLRLEQDLRRALAENQFELHYQPLVDLRDNRMTGCEALLRWRHPQRGMIPPLDFIPLAEDTGLIDEIGDWVLRTATAEAATWPADIRIAVNVSPVQLKSQSLALRVAGALAASGLAPQRLEIEITEAVLIRDDETALNILHQLHEIGVRIALDDFGTGYSSLSYLKRFPFDKIKIDRCFVSDLEVGGSSAIVQAVVGIAAASNMTTTAEGVETGQQQALLRQLGCTEMQGYLFSAPKPASELRNLFVPAGSARAAG